MMIDKTLRQVGGSVAVTVPPEILRAYRLNPGDAIRWIVGEDGISIEFFRVTKTVSVTMEPIPAERVMVAAE